MARPVKVLSGATVMEIINKRNAGVPITQIAKELGLNYKTLMKKINEYEQGDFSNVTTNKTPQGKVKVINKQSTRATVKQDIKKTLDLMDCLQQAVLKLGSFAEISNEILDEIKRWKEYLREIKQRFQKFINKPNLVEEQVKIECDILRAQIDIIKQDMAITTMTLKVYSSDPALKGVASATQSLKVIYASLPSSIVEKQADKRSLENQQLIDDLKNSINKTEEDVKQP